MALLQITEPGVDSAPHARRLAAGIDLGTTHSLVASVRSGEVQCLPDASGDVLLPSVVHYSASGDPQVGRAAVEQAQADPTNTIASVKRLMGRTRADLATLSGQLPFAVDDGAVPRIHTAAGPRTAIEVSADILGALRQRAEHTLGDVLEGVVVTVPAYFDDTQRQATRDAAGIAGLNVLRLLAEPTAAAVAYGLDQAFEDRDEAMIAVFDLGGGTFDISILRLSRGVFEVLATGGDSALGGDDFDRRVAEWLLAEAGIHEPTPETLWAVLSEARRAKEALTDHERVELQRPGHDTSVTLDRARFAELVEPLVARTLRCCRSTLADADRVVGDIAEVVLVGGSTRMPVIRDAVEAWFGRPPHVEIDPDQVVAMGAALQADRLVGNRPDDELLLLDVIPLSLGIETMGGLTEVLIPRNAPIPVTRGQDFTTFKDGQTALALHVVQGERDVVEENRSLARFTLHGIPPMAAGAARIRVSFQVDADGLLHVEAHEQTSGMKAQIEVKPSHGLTEDEISDMLRRSNASAADDMRARALREQQVEADRVLEAIDAALKADGDEFLSDDERAAIGDAIVNLLAVRRESTDADAIEAAREALESVAETFVARRMNASVRKALAGRNLDAIR